MSGALEQAFALAAGELGMASAAWLFAEQVHGAGGDEKLEALRESLGRRWPILDAICAAWLEGLRAPAVELSGLQPALEGLHRLVIVGVESRWLDALAQHLPPSVRLGLIRHSELSPDWARVMANLPRVELVELADFQSWAGPHSALLSFVYGGGSGGGPFALGGWLRVAGPDVRTQFRELIGWDVLRVPIAVYPRWLVAVPHADFTLLEAAP